MFLLCACARLILAHTCSQAHKAIEHTKHKIHRIQVNYVSFKTSLVIDTSVGKTYWGWCIPMKHHHDLNIKPCTSGLNFHDSSFQSWERDPWSHGHNGTSWLCGRQNYVQNREENMIDLPVIKHKPTNQVKTPLLVHIPCLVSMKKKEPLFVLSEALQSRSKCRLAYGRRVERDGERWRTEMGRGGIKMMMLPQLLNQPSIAFLVPPLCVWRYSSQRRRRDARVDDLGSTWVVCASTKV